MKTISVDALRHMEGKEGLILQGCGGSPQEWVDGINEMLTEAGILLAGSKLNEVSSFENDGMTNLLFSFEGAELDCGKLAIWRLRTHAQFGGTWLSDYVANKLGGFEQEQKPQKPDCALIGEDGNIFNLIGIAARTLRHCEMGEEARQMQARITGGDCHSYDEALGIISEYVNITGHDDQSQGMGGMEL